MKTKKKVAQKASQRKALDAKNKRRKIGTARTKRPEPMTRETPGR